MSRSSNLSGSLSCCMRMMIFPMFAVQMFDNSGGISDELDRYCPGGRLVSDAWHMHGGCIAFAIAFPFEDE